MSFVRQSGRHPVSVVPLSGVKEATVGENAHGNQIVLTATESDRSIELFVDGDHYDMEAPILITKTGRHRQTEACVAATVVENPAVVTVGDRERPANLFSLEMDGIAATLPNPPVRPKLPGHNSP